jgi:hypothetical protein
MSPYRTPAAREPINIYIEPMPVGRRTLALRQFVAVSLMLLAVLYALGHVVGCLERPMTPQEKAVVADHTYTAEMLACVAKSATLAESTKCRAEVRRTWGVDGGAR